MDMETYSAMNEQMSSGQSTATSLISLAICVLTIVAMWKIFSKAGQAGWKSIIPIYNVYTLFKIADGNGWKFLLLLIPIVNIVYTIMINFRLAKSFGKGVGFGFGLLFLPTIFTLVLAFGSASYVGPKGLAVPQQ